MTANQSRLLGIAILLAFIALILHLSKSGEAESGSAAVAIQPGAADSDYERAKARLAQGPYVASIKRLSENEEIEVIVIPESYATESDTRCIVYKNFALGSSSLTCSGTYFPASSASNAPHS
jgi:hypothetical protein